MTNDSFLGRRAWGPKSKWRFLGLFFSQKCHVNLGSREQQAILPDQFDHAWSIAIADRVYPNRRRFSCFLFSPIFCSSIAKYVFPIRHPI